MVVVLIRIRNAFQLHLGGQAIIMTLRVTIKKYSMKLKASCMATYCRQTRLTLSPCCGCEWIESLGRTAPAIHTVNYNEFVPSLRPQSVANKFVPYLSIDGSLYLRLALVI